MANPEHKTGNGVCNTIEVLALFQLGQIRKEDMDENNRFVLDFYLGLMAEDPEFRERVDRRKNEMTMEAKNGKKSPLYSENELKNAKKHRKHKIARNKALQPRLFDETFFQTGNRKNVFGYEKVIDPERKLTKLHKESNRASSKYLKSLISQEMGYKRNKLRETIGLPIARGKDPHVKDSFYRFLVKRVVELDVFRIFNDYYDTKFEEPDNLRTRILQVQNLISELLNTDSHNEKYSKYHQFINDYGEEWGIIYDLSFFRRYVSK